MASMGDFEADLAAAVQGEDSPLMADDREGHDRRVDEKDPKQKQQQQQQQQQQQLASKTASLVSCLRDEVPRHVTRLLWVAVVLAGALFLGASQTQDECWGHPVATKQGLVCGRQATSKGGALYRAFQGIPYAKPPTGSLRFKDPKPAEPWEGVKHALRPGPPCLQSGQGSVVESLSPTLRQAILLVRALPGFFSALSTGRQQSEDCLFLNVYTRQVTPPKPQAVMVWFHGGGFHMGSGSTDVYGPDYLLDDEDGGDDGVVLVTLNYRLGPLGFLSVPGGGVSGNAGLKDQAAALRWVRDNIASFGGDPNRVTIFGESAGGTSVQMHMLSPVSRGLFHGAISQSGSALNPRSSLTLAEGRERAYRLGRMLGIEPTDDADLVKRLLQVPAHLLTAKSESVLTSAERSRGLAVHPFVPSEEHAVQGAFLPGTPVQLLVRGVSADVPYITGINSLEAGFIINKMLDRSSLNLEEEVENLVPSDLSLEYGSPERANLAKEMKREYLGDKDVTTDMELAQFHSDMFVSLVVHRTVNMLSRRASPPLYVYYFSHDGGRSLSQRLLDKRIPGVFHTDELGYIFTQSVVPSGRETEVDELVTKKMVKLWTNFAKTGNPNSRSPLLTTEWLPANNRSQLFLEISPVLTMRQGPITAKVSFWDNVYTAEQGGLRE